MAALKSGEAKASIFGTDYSTKDGTCVRDYIHVVDLVDAHVLALEALFKGNCREVYNLGSEAGFSVREVIETCRSICERTIDVAEGPRRPGDTATLIARSEKIKRDLGWNPRHTNLDAIISHAWNWLRFKVVDDAEKNKSLV